MNKWGTLFLSAAVCLSIAASGHQAEAGRFNMSYLYFGSPNTYVSQVDATKGSLTDVTPNYFELDGNGNLALTSQYSDSFVDAMHQRQVKVVPFLSNHWDKQIGMAALANRENLAQQIADKIQEYQLDGINIDIEGLNEASRDSFTSFIELLRQKVPQGKEVSVAVAANPTGDTKGWAASYDYASLAKQVDYLMIMTYDESYEGSAEGPVASISFVEKSIQYALNIGVPSDKVVLGIPFYGRLWSADGSIKGLGVSQRMIAPLLTKYHGTTAYDTDKQAAKATFQIPTGSTEVVSYTTLPAGTYTIWFENEQSLREKFKLVSKYNLKGTGSWSLNQEDPTIWDWYMTALNGQFFKDVPVNYWAANDIQSVVDKKYMSGNGDNTFAPEKALTRREGAIALVNALGLDKGQALDAKDQFSDTASLNWGSRQIALARHYGLVGGFPDGTFQPDEPLTREQIAKVLNNIFHYSYDAAGSNPFDDIAQSYAKADILAMQQHQIVQGVSLGKFDPAGTTTRAQLATLLNKLSPDIEQKKNEYN
jgi:spore germination protein YaaH